MKIIKENYSDSKPSVLIVDPTIIKKWFAKKIDGLSYDRHGVIQKSKACLVPVIAAWTNTKITIPFYVALDGAFASDGMIKIFIKNVIHFACEYQETELSYPKKESKRSFKTIRS